MRIVSKILARLGRERPALADQLKLVLPLVDAAYYEKRAADFKSSNLTAAEHYIRFGCQQGLRPNEYFDPKWYVDQYPDVKSAGVFPLLHYAEFGWKERRNPGSRFYTNAYLLMYPDVLLSGRDPLVHYLEHGAREGRTILPVGIDLTNYVSPVGEPMPSFVSSSPRNNRRVYRQFSALISGEICA
jgi:hypothetical protein